MVGLEGAIVMRAQHAALMWIAARRRSPTLRGTFVAN
jgi:hypothetical protein